MSEIKQGEKISVSRLISASKLFGKGEGHTAEHVTGKKKSRNERFIYNIQEEKKKRSWHHRVENFSFLSSFVIEEFCFVVFFLVLSLLSGGFFFGMY